MPDSPRADGRPNGDNTPMLGDEQMEQIVTFKMTGMSDRQIAEQIGVSRPTVQRFVNRPEFQAALVDAHKELVDGASRRLASAAAPAANILLLAMNPRTEGVPWPTRVKAAETVYRMLGVEKMAQALDNQATATYEAAKATLREKLEQMAPRVIEAQAIEPRLELVEDDDDQGEARQA